MFRSETVTLAPAWRAVLQAEGLDSVAGVYGRADGLVITRTRSTEVRRLEVRGAPGARLVFLKKYWVSRAAQLWSGLLRGAWLGRCKAQREFLNLGRLRGWGLDAPAGLAWGEERRAGFVVRSFLISEGVVDPMPLDRLIRDVLPALPSDQGRRLRASLIGRLADYTRRLHGHRFVHHDYYWRNIILSGMSLDHFALIDAHKGAVWSAWAGRRSRAKDLATLDAPAGRFFRRTERLRFLLAYLGERRLSRSAKRLARAVLRTARPLRERELRRVTGARQPRPATA